MLFNTVPHLDSRSAAALYGLPRCSPHRYCDTSTPIVGSSGSIPLQFPAANGHKVEPIDHGADSEGNITSPFSTLPSLMILAMPAPISAHFEKTQRTPVR